MLHGHIVDMIDACLERLQAARRLLTPSRDSLALEDLLEASAHQAGEPKKKVRPAIRTKKIQKDALTASLFAEALEIEATTPVSDPFVPLAMGIGIEVAEETTPQAFPASHEPEPRRSSTGVSTRRKTVTLPSALVHHVPAQPVFISAAQVRQENTQKKAETPAAKAEANKPAAAPLTAELLARRWIQSADA